MKYVLRKICFILILISPAINATPSIFEDFSGAMSVQKFDDTEITLDINTTGELALSSKAKSFLPNIPKANALSLLNSESAKTISADIKLTELNLGSSETQQAMLRVSGTFYGTSGGTYRLTPTFLTWVALNIGDRGNGLEAWYEILIDSYDAQGNYITSASNKEGSLSTDLSFNSTYRATISYDGSTNFTFSLNENIVSVSGPASTGEVPFRKGVASRLRFGQNNNTPAIFEDELPDDGSTAYISGTVDNVTTDIEGLEDNFSSNNLDKWNNSPVSTQITDDGQLKFSVAYQAGTSRTQKTIRLEQQDLKYFGAKVTLSSDSTPSETARIRARVGHYLGNDTYDVSNGDTANEFEGSIWSQMVIDRFSDGSFRASAYIERADDAPYTRSTQIVSQALTPATPIEYDVQYAMAIEQIGNVVNFIIDGEILFSYDLTTSGVFSGNLYNNTSDARSQLTARIQSGLGDVVVLFDDIVTDFSTNPENPINIDGNGEVAALTDGLLVLRHLFGFQGDGLINGAIGSDAIRTTATDTTTRLQQLSTGNMLLDIDGNAVVEPLTDGLLLLRYLFGFRGESLINGVIGTEATRTTAADVEAYFQQLTGQ